MSLDKPEIGKRWQTFFKKLDQWKELPIEEWKEYQLLGYLMDRAEKFLGRKLAITLSGQPSKCPEIFFIKKIIYSLDTTDQELVKNYIDWVFDNKIIPGNVKIRSIGYFQNNSFANQFLNNIKKSQVVTRTTNLPIEYKMIVDFFKVPAETYGDLAFVQKALEVNPDDEDSETYKKMFFNLKTIGFKDSILKELK